MLTFAHPSLPAVTSSEPPNLAYHYDIPGTRCGPEDGPWPRTYQLLSEAQLSKELDISARPQSRVFNAENGWKADSLNFQPCNNYRTQDRYVVQELLIEGEKWTLTGVFDGHLGDTTVEHTAHHMPIIIRDFLRKAVKQNAPNPLSADAVGDILKESIKSFDEAIANDVLALFPGGLESLSSLSDLEIQKVINDHYNGGRNYNNARLCMYGTTALVALVDPQHENLWVANLGDCQAVLLSPNLFTGAFDSEILNTMHNGDNDDEVERVRREHPGEPSCVTERRVLGAIAPFRCIGDVPFKQPPEFTRRILYNLYPGFHDTSPWEEFLVRNRTPPYISSEAEIIHRPLTPKRGGCPIPLFNRGLLNTPRPLLILCSDGLSDLYHGLTPQEMAAVWARNLTLRGQLTNLALQLLRDAIGGPDTHKVSQMLTLDMDSPWIDDVAIVVQAL
ncbi:hypothetical protein JAAARDRAFT_205725 [Jaapia argillacea MUCL 33604]|uniref:PPM-type phosphatase domain-containing protein n=1 Tax=Jaapia argillacea MUCL 33604 TaxID=933084 RepID=A0A067QAY7_9AGAM|nr:hypothetical protein JAAARDRAFT_205725 [Jaapia argillacea MUCL 33604]